MISFGKSDSKNRSNYRSFYPAFAQRSSKSSNLVGLGVTLTNSSLLKELKGKTSQKREALKTFLNQQKELSQLTRIEVKSKWSHLKISVPYAVPDYRQMENVSKRVHANLNISLNLSQNISKHGKFTQREDNTIRENFLNFCSHNEIDDSSLLVHHNGVLSRVTRKNFVLCLAENIPDRSLRSIYERFIRIHTNYIEGKFCKQEDKIIKLFMTEPGKNPFRDLSILLNREKDSIFRRYQILKQSKTPDGNESLCHLGNENWNHVLVENVLNCVLNVSSCTNIKQLKNVTIPMKTWIKVGKEVGIGARKLKDYWDQRLSTQLFAKKPVFRDKTLLKLINILYEEKVRYRQDVIWTEVAKDFHGISGLFLWTRLRRLIREYLPKERHSDFRFCIKHLYKYWCPTYGKYVDQEFQRLAFKNGILETRRLKLLNSSHMEVE